MSADDRAGRTADELEIRNVIAQLALLTDTGSVEDYVALFTEDAHWEVRDVPGSSAPSFAPVDGRANILAAAKKRRAEGLAGPGSHNYHVLSPPVVTLKGDTATAISYLIFFKNATTKPESTLFRIYKDNFRRTPQGWKLAARYIEPA
jgi:hypothetical protein